MTEDKVKLVKRSLIGIVLICAIVYFGRYELEYRNLIKESYKMEEGYDFARLRDVHSSRIVFFPYRMDPIADFNALLQTLKKPGVSAGQEIMDYVRTHAAYPQTYSAVSRGHEEQESFTGKYHAWMHDGLVNVLEDSGDGLTPETAFNALSKSEIHMIAKRYVEGDIKADIDMVGFKKYMYVDGPDKETGQPRRVWFQYLSYIGFIP